MINSMELEKQFSKMKISQKKPFESRKKKYLGWRCSAVAEPLYSM
jgi:hypothetical protein